MPTQSIADVPTQDITAASQFETVTLADGWAGTTTMHQATQSLIGGLPYAATSLQTPPPPRLSSPSDVERWWWIGLGVLPVLMWALASRDHYWADVLQTSTRVCFFGGVAMGMWLLYRRAALGRSWREVEVAGVVGLVLMVMAGMSLALAQPAALLQAQQAERSGDFAQAVAIYQHADDTADAARAQIAWGSKLVDQGNFIAAKQHLTAGIAAADSATRAEGHAALGRLYWLWGQMSLQQGKVADARAEWTLATVQAAGTADGDHAAAALAAPQNVTGHVIWLGQPMPALRVVLISSWAYSSASQSLQSSGERLAAATGEDGSFTITGAKPGVTYALIWVGTFGDTTRIDAQGNPIFTVKVRSLESTDMGTVNIGTPTSPSAGNDNT